MPEELDVVAAKETELSHTSEVADILPLSDEILRECAEITAKVSPKNEELVTYTSMPFFVKLTKDRQDRYVKEFQVKQLLHRFAEGKKPESMSDRQWKSVLKQKFQFLTRAAYKEYSLNKKRKLQEKRKETKKQKTETDGEKKDILVKEQSLNGIRLIIDCAFDDLMLPKEVKSMSTQISRIYNCNRVADRQFDEIIVSCFNKRLKERFDKDLTSYTKWSSQGKVKFEEEDIVKQSDTSQMIYLSADAEEELENFEEGKQYVIGGIVDKGRYKSLCYNKAKELGIKSVKLPIGEYIKLHGNKVLTSLHVVQLMNEFLANGRNWEAAFEKIMPKRKVIEESNK